MKKISDPLMHKVYDELDLNSKIGQELEQLSEPAQQLMMEFGLKMNDIHYKRWKKIKLKDKDFMRSSDLKKHSKEAIKEAYEFMKEERPKCAMRYEKLNEEFENLLKKHID